MKNEAKHSWRGRKSDVVCRHCGVSRKFISSENKWVYTKDGIDIDAPYVGHLFDLKLVEPVCEGKR